LADEEKSVEDARLDDLIRKNVEAIARIEAAALSNRSRADIVADAIAGFCGSMGFIYVHCVAIVGWLVWNTTQLTPPNWRFDPPPYNALMLVAGVEAIFLSTFILISQNRQQRAADQRNHLDLQINMLAEQENSQMLIMMKQVMENLGVRTAVPHDPSLSQETDLERLAEQIQETQNLENS
jgi:uncharacterized membrane protein